MQTVPESWTVVDLNALRAQGEYTFVGGPFGSNLTQADYVPSPGVPVIRGTNMGGSESRFIDENFVYVTEDKAAELRSNLAFPGDLVFTQRGTLGQVALIPLGARFQRYVISQSQMKLTPDPERVDRQYLYHYFRTPQALRHLLGQTQATGVPHINLGILKRTPIILPPLPEQRRIAEVLDRAEALRAKRRAALALLDTLIQSIFHDLFGDPATNPKSWPVVRVGDLLSSATYGTSERASASGEYPVLRMNNISRRGEIDLHDLKYMDLQPNERDRYLVKPGDILFNRTNSAELVGKTALFRHPNPMAYAGYLIRLRVNEDTEPEYLAAFMNSRYMKKVLRRMCKSIIGMANINATELKGISVGQPPLELQKAFAGRVAAVEKLKSAQRASLAQLDALFASLQHRAFRGEL